MTLTSIKRVTIVANLVLGNAIVFVMAHKEGGARFAIHSVFSITACVLLFLLFRFANRAKRLSSVFIASIAGAFLVPVISIYVLFTGSALWGLMVGTWPILKDPMIGPIPDSLIYGLPYALIVGVVSWFLWLPMSILNSLFLRAYVKSIRSANQAL